MNTLIRNLGILLLLSSFTASLYAADVARPGANNKTGLTKKTQEERENSIINRILRGDYDGPSFNNNDELDSIKLDIKELKEKKSVAESSIDSNDRVLNQIKILSELRKDGVLTEEEFNKNKKLLLDKLNQCHGD